MHTRSNGRTGKGWGLIRGWGVWKEAWALVLLAGVWLAGVGGTVAWAEPEPVERPALVLVPGEQRNLRIPGLLQYSLGSDVVRARSTSDSILIKAIKPGHADLWVRKSDGTSENRPIEVNAKPETLGPPALLRALSRLQEVEIIYGGDGKPVLRGEIHSLEEASRVGALRAQIEDQTRLTPILVARGKEKLEDWLRTSGHSETLRIENRGDQLWVRGSLSRPSEYAGVSRQIRSRFPWVEFEIDTLPDSAPTIHFQVYLLELRRTHFRNLGLNWPKALEGSFQLAPQRGWGATQLDLALQALEGDGAARVLSRPELVVRAPGEAELFAGGELPIQAMARFFANVMWKNFGLTLRLKVTHAAGDRVRLEVFTEVSHLDGSIALNEVPGIQSNRMKTQVDARYGTPLFLSGLLQKNVREHARGLPLLREIPVLGKLFGSEDYLNERSELVAILLPMSTPPRAELDRWRELEAREHTGATVAGRGPVSGSLAQKPDSSETGESGLLTRSQLVPHGGPPVSRSRKNADLAMPRQVSRQVSRPLSRRF
jgi:Flp pilus assembly secretin CpaC